MLEREELMSSSPADQLAAANAEQKHVGKQSVMSALLPLLVVRGSMHSSKLLLLQTRKCAKL